MSSAWWFSACSRSHRTGAGSFVSSLTARCLRADLPLTSACPAHVLRRRCPRAGCVCVWFAYRIASSQRGSCPSPFPFGCRPLPEGSRRTATRHSGQRHPCPCPDPKGQLSVSPRSTALAVGASCARSSCVRFSQHLCRDRRCPGTGNVRPGEDGGGGGGGGGLGVGQDAGHERKTSPVCLVCGRKRHRVLPGRPGGPVGVCGLQPGAGRGSGAVGAEGSKWGWKLRAR